MTGTQMSSMGRRPMAEYASQRELARIIRTVTYNAYIATLVGSAPPCTLKFNEFLRKPEFGQWVMETTTVGMGNRSDLDGVGILLRITQEPVVFSDPDFAWDEEVEGQPHPTEACTYIRTIDGREFRWTNASFIAVPTKLMPSI
jgi:hypothetical protein